MSEYEPITGELRRWLRDCCPPYNVDEHGTRTEPTWEGVCDLCDAIDAVHAQLERENAELRERVAVLDNRSENMHDGMSVTDELRAWWVRKFPVMDKELHKDFTAITDRIDVEHQKAVRELNNLADGCVLLPLDADGVPIRVGDVMEWPTTHETFEVVGIGDGTLFYIEDGRERADWTGASTKRRHHAPTVEDVLREMADRCYADEDEPRDRDAIVAEYAAKLRLAGDAS